MKRAAAPLAAACLALAAGACGAEEIGIDRSQRGAFSLLTHAGKRVTERSFDGRYLLVSFGYVSCPDVCPTVLATIGEALRALGPAQERVQSLFVTLDPERDTGAVLGAYVEHFHPRMVGLTGTADEIAAAAQAYGVVHARYVTAGSRGHYAIDHSAVVYLVGPDGRFRAAFDDGTGARGMAAGLMRHMKEKSP